MLSNSPSRLFERAECTDFLVKITRRVDEPEGLDGKVGDFLLLARRSGRNGLLEALPTGPDARWLLTSHSSLR